MLFRLLFVCALFLMRRRRWLVDASLLQGVPIRARSSSRWHVDYLLLYRQATRPVRAAVDAIMLAGYPWKLDVVAPVVRKLQALPTWKDGNHAPEGAGAL